ncbi:MAG: hypothetical protein IKK19_07615, partial [Bacteroidales bacterium]|nr:hypothetical protein [Bacteroidales bacterium]
SSRQLAVRKHILELLGKNGRMKIGQIETIAADEYKFYLQVLREMIDNGEVSANGEYIERK